MATRLPSAGAFYRVVLEAHADMVRTLSLAAWDSIIQMSPVDTGYFRASWNLSIGAEQFAVPAPGPSAVPSRPNLLTLPFFPKVTIANGLPYAVALELGHSAQAPQGMVRITLMNLADSA